MKESKIGSAEAEAGAHVDLPYKFDKRFILYFHLNDNLPYSVAVSRPRHMEVFREEYPEHAFIKS